MKTRIVVFGPNGARIYKGVDPAEFKGQSFLINPSIPPGVPPHLWRKAGDQIVVVEPEQAQVDAPKAVNTRWIYTVGAIVGAAIVAACYLCAL